MNSEQFLKITDYIKGCCGITLGPGKEYLIEQRLSPILPEFGFADLATLSNSLGAGTTTALREKIIVSMTTNETLFFRDGHPYDALRQEIMPKLIQLVKERENRLIQRKGAKVSIWSAACSTGQEPYSIAMSILSYLQSHFLNVKAEEFRIVATDISSRVLAQAIEGKYNETEIVRGLPELFRDRYFRKEGDDWFIHDECKQLVEFQSINLTKSFAHLGGFDMIFCRNILIYFDEKTKLDILTQMCNMLPSGGLLVLGSAENLFSYSLPLQSVRFGNSVVYEKE